GCVAAVGGVGQSCSPRRSSLARRVRSTSRRLVPPRTRAAFRAGEHRKEMTVKARAYKVVDVFTDTPLQGNPVAVVLDAEGLDRSAMQRIARWTNLAETTFVLPAVSPGADYRRRIFTRRSELPFAGHPTLRSAHAALEAGRVKPRDGGFMQE